MREKHNSCTLLSLSWLSALYFFPNEFLVKMSHCSAAQRPLHILLFLEEPYIPWHLWRWPIFHIVFLAKLEGNALKNPLICTFLTWLGEITSFGSNSLIAEILLLPKILLKIKDLACSCFLELFTELLKNQIHCLQDNKATSVSLWTSCSQYGTFSGFKWF